MYNYADVCFVVQYLCHFGVPASVSFLHLSQDVHLQQTFDFVPLLEGVAVCALLALQLCVLSCDGQDTGRMKFPQSKHQPQFKVDSSVLQNNRPSFLPSFGRWSL